MTSLDVTLGGQPFDHMVYHFVLTYSNWETVSICFSESFESLSDGLQQALWELGGVPQRHRTDRMSAAVNNLSDQKEFTRRYQALMGHYGLIMEKINAREAHENGDAEQSHNRFKQAVDQALQLRGSRDFADRIAYARFLREVRDQRNAGRQKHLAEERAALASLPPGRLESYKRARVRVGAGSVIRVDRNIYSVHSRLVGEKVDVRLYVEHLEVWYAGMRRRADPASPWPGEAPHQLPTRDRLAGAQARRFENYEYREDCSPRADFAWPTTRCARRTPDRAAREYLQILELAARESETVVDDALRLLLEEDQAMTRAAVEEWVGRRETARPVTDVQVEVTNLSSFDELFRHKEVWDGIGGGGETTAGGVPARAPSADVS